MEHVVELAFEGLRVFARLILPVLEALIDVLRAVVKAFLHIVLEIFVDVIAEPCGRGWQRLHRWVGRVTGLPRLAVPITLLLVMALIAGIYLSFVIVGRLFF
jgi:hypothetical protein